MSSQSPKFGATIIVDAPNFFMTCKDLGFHPSIRRARNLISETFNVVSTVCVFTIPKYFSGDHDSFKLKKYCERRNIKTVTRELRWNDRKIDIDVEVATEVTEASHDPNTKVIILFSGDRDFCRAVAIARKNKRHVVVISSVESTAAELIKQADEFIDIATIRNHIERKK